MDDASELETAEFELPVSTDPIDSPRMFSSLVRIDFGAMSHRGRVRGDNEDSYLVSRTGRYWERHLTNLPGDQLPERFDENGYIFIVADGMGGQAGGKIASRLAIRTGINLMLSSPNWALKLDDPATRQEEINEGIERTREFFRRIDKALARHAASHPGLSGMGTTFTAAYSYGNDLFIFHVGDSRAYLFREEKLQRLTRDQTMAQSLADLGSIKPEEVDKHRWSHVLTEAMGQRGGRVNVDVQLLKLQDGDRLLLCTDGLTDMVEEDQMANALRKSRGQSSSATCKQLIDLALEQGGKDNVTAVLAAYSIPSPS